MDIFNEETDPSFSLAPEGITQLKGLSKWTRFIGVVFVIFGSILLFATVLLAANFSSLMEKVVQVNGIEKDKIDMLEQGGKYMIGLVLLISASVLVINGILLFRFGSHSRQYIDRRNAAELGMSFDQLKKYLYFSFIMAVISAILSLVSTVVFFGSGV